MLSSAKQCTLSTVHQARKSHFATCSTSTAELLEDHHPKPYDLNIKTHCSVHAKEKKMSLSFNSKLVSVPHRGHTVQNKEIESLPNGKVLRW